MNQLDIPDYKYFLGCNAKRTVRITFIVKKFVFHTEICLRLIQIIIFELFFFDRVKELSKSNQTWYGVSHVYLEYKIKIISAIACLEKVRISIRNIDSFSYSILKIIEIFSDQRVVQSEPN